MLICSQISHNHRYKHKQHTDEVYLGYEYFKKHLLYFAFQQLINKIIKKRAIKNLRLDIDIGNLDKIVLSFFKTEIKC